MADEPQITWGQQSSSGAKDGPITDRRHQLVTGLPAWDPLPPGEILVVRPQRD